MSISTVKATINGVEHTLEYNQETGKWEKSITAPNITSYNQDGGYFGVTINATNNAGTTATLTAEDDDNLKLVVEEKIKPVITLISPSSGAYVISSLQPIVFNVTDEINGSGIDTSTISIKVDGNAITNITRETITNGYKCTATPTTALADGSHTITINVSDNDGNTATTVTSTFTVDTVPPTLNITSPQNNLVTASTTINVTGTTNDITSNPATIAIKVNNTDVGTVTVDSQGNFTKAVTLSEGANTIKVTATDQAGKTTVISLSVTLDTSVPVISNVSITPNPADAGATILVSVEVE